MNSEISEMERSASPLELPDFLYLEREKLRKDPEPSEANKLYLFFWHPDGQIIYSLYEIEVPKRLPPPPTKAVKCAEISNPSSLYPILEFETGMYPIGMCCVQLGSELYFLGGKFKKKKDLDIMDIKSWCKFGSKNEEQEIWPKDVYVFDLTLYNKRRPFLERLKANLLLKRSSMKCGKPSPQTFVADEKLYVIGSNFRSFDRSCTFFEVYDPVTGMWTDLPNLPSNANTIWVGNAVVGRKAVLVALQLGQERLYCFDLDTSQWTNRVSIPDFPAGNFFSGKTEFVEDTLYGCYFNTIGAIAPLLNNEEEKEEWEEWEEEEEEEGEEVQQIVRLLKNHRLHLVSEEMGMDAIFDVPLQLRSSSSLLHLGNRYFCYVRSGTEFRFQEDDEPFPDRKRFISIIIFQAPVYNENAIATRFFRANFVYSKHYCFLLRNSVDLFIKGCYANGEIPEATVD